MSIEEKFRDVESRSKINHPPKEFRKLIEAHIPETIQIPMIQVAGTNGKGSVTRWIENLADVEKVGSFTSPHLIRHTERIAVNKKPIPDDDWNRIYDKWRDFFYQNNLSSFEVDLWMALVWFHEQQADLAVMEAGLGGERDATTALPYVCQGITNIGMDHMALLGNTLEEIALAKAGIMRKGCPVLTTEKKMFGVLQEQARQTDTTIELAVPTDIPHNLPSYQSYNLALAKALLNKAKIKEKDFDLSSFFWPGRMQVISTEPLQIVDGAHNLPAVQQLVQNLPPVSAICFSVLADKQADEMIELLKTTGLPVMLVYFDEPRLANLEELARRHQLPILSFDQAMKLDVSCLYCGSLHFAGQILKAKKK